MADVIETRPEPDLTSAEGLADALGLDRRDVAAVHVESTETSQRTSLAFLDVVYAGAVAVGSLPTRLVLKRTPQAMPGAKPVPAQEADFYVRLAPALPSPPVVRCVAARAPSAASAGYVLIEDLRATHVEPAPDEEMDFGPAVDVLARIHAARWEVDDDRFNGSSSEQSIRAAVQRIGARLPVFFDTAGDALPANGRRLYERVFSSALRPWLRPLDRRALTLIHGDAHGGNFLVPREPEGDVYLIDWNRWTADVGARDLAFLLLRSSPDRRRRIEEPLLRRYHARLEALGVRGYGWDDLWSDYRRCWVRNLTIPVMRQARGRSDESWRELLNHAVVAVVDLDGDDLL